MANKPLTILQIRKILMLLGDGLSSRAISKKLGIHRKTVESYRARITLTGKTPSELRRLEDAELDRALSPRNMEAAKDQRRADFKARVTGSVNVERRQKKQRVKPALRLQARRWRQA